MVYSSFFLFTEVVDAQGLANELRALAVGLTGSILVAQEGMSGAVAGGETQVAAFEAALHGETFFGGIFRAMAFKRSDSALAPFGRMAVKVRPYLIASAAPTLGPRGASAESRLSPLQWRELLAQEDCVVIDNRNHFEYRLGHFRHAVDPAVQHFTDFSHYVERHLAQWRATGRPLALYCTGGIRCERVAPWLESLGLKVWQLDGGILHYFATLPDAEREWQGACFVFDNRLAVDTALRALPMPPEAIYDAAIPDEQWRLQRALKLREDSI